MSDSNQVSALFERETVATIRERLRKCRGKIEENKEEMRETVGARYRDIIESADSIEAMRQCCNSIITSVSSMSERCHDLRGSPTPDAFWQPQFGSPAGGAGRTLLFGNQLKFLVETPAHIWANLERTHVLDATIR